MSHKSGFVNIIGKPNVGKSTLMNALVGQKLSITTHKVQTTRHRIMGIVNGEDFQIVYSDTPGILAPNYKLQQSMLNFIEGALQDADIFLLVVEVGEKSFHEEFLERVRKTGKPIILAINKLDLSNQEEIEQKAIMWQELIPEAMIIPVSALHKFNLEPLMKAILKDLPEFPAYYPKDEISDKNVRFFVTEIIREKILENYKKEIPYAVEIEILSYKDEPDIVKISSVIYVERNTQKGILIGHQGKALKKVGIEARKDIEKFVDKKVFLEMNVKVRKGWRDDENQLKKFGYEG